MRFVHAECEARHLVEHKSITYRVLDNGGDEDVKRLFISATSVCTTHPTGGIVGPAHVKVYRLRVAEGGFHHAQLTTAMCLSLAY